MTGAGPPRRLTRKEAHEAYRRAVDAADRALRERTICTACGATGATYERTCKAGPADDCEGFLAIRAAREAAIRERMG